VDLNLDFWHNFYATITTYTVLAKSVAAPRVNAKSQLIEKINIYDVVSLTKIIY
jgi:hypothetical protein